MSSNATGSTEILVSPDTTVQQQDASVAAFSDGGWLVTWHSYGEVGENVYTKLYDADGVLYDQDKFSYTNVPLGSSGYQYSSSVTTLEDGGWVIVVNPTGLDGSGSGIYQKHYDADGTAGDLTLVNSYTSSDQTTPSVTSLANGGWVVAWQSLGQSGVGYNIYQQRYNAGGNRVGVETGINNTSSSSQSDPSVTGLADGGWIVTWQERNEDSSDIHQQRYAANGSKSGVEELVTSGTDASVTALHDGGWVVAWEYTEDGDNIGIYQQRYDDQGNKSGDAKLVSASTEAYQDNPTVTALANFGWVVTWDAYDKDGEGWGVYQQRFGLNGLKSGNETQVNITTEGDQEVSSVVALADGGWVVTWQTSEIDGENTAISQRHFAANVVGNDKANKLVGTNWDEYLFGNGGNDILNGKGGDDVMAGGTGNDTYIVNSRKDVADESDGSGTDTVKASVSWKLGAGFENLSLTGTAVIDATGNGADNVLNGNAKANVLSGGDGDDIMIGGAGDDSYYVDSPRDKVVEAGGNGRDKVYSSFSITLQIDENLASNIKLLKYTGSIEQVELTGSRNLTGYGNALDNVITGNSGDNVLRGFAGNDTLFGGDGSDVLRGGSGADKMNGGSGIDIVEYSDARDGGLTVNLSSPARNTGYAKGDTYVSIENLRGSAGDDKLTGTAVANTIYGDEGNDTVEGGGGADRLYGGSGSDRFIFSTVSASTHDSMDTIYDLTSADDLDLRGIDANANMGGNQSFKFIGTGTFDGHAGELRFVTAHSDAYIYGDVDGDKTADLQIHLDDAVSIKSLHFML